MRHLAWLVAAFLVAASALAGVSVSAAAAVAPPTIGVTLGVLASGDLGAGEALRSVVTIANPTSDDTVASTATLSADPTPFTTRASLADWFSGATKTALATRVIGTTSAPPVPSKQSGSADLDVAGSSLPFTKAGVYAVSVTLTSGGSVIGTARSAVAWNGAAAASVPVSIAVPLTVPAGQTEFLTAAQLTTYTAPTGILSTELAAVQASQVAVGIDPRIIASIRVLGKSAPVTAIDWLNSLAALQNETFPLAWADADLTAPLRAGAHAVVVPKTLDYAIDPSLFGDGTGSTPTPTPTPTAGADDSVVPTSAALVAWNYTLPALQWPADGSVETGDLPALNSAGITSAIVTTSNIHDSDARGLEGASGVSASTTLAVSDDVLSGYFRAAAAASTREAQSLPLTELTTTLALIGLRSGASPRTVLLTLDRNWASTDIDLPQTIGDLYARSWVTPANVSTIFTQAPNKLVLGASTESVARTELVRAMLRAEVRVVRFAPVAAIPAAVSSAYRLRLLSMLSDEWLGNSATWKSAARAFIAQADALVGSVQVQKSSTYLGLADQVGLPVSIANGFDQDATVVLRVRSTSLSVSIKPSDEVQTITIGANSQKRIQIPIEALTNGKARLIISLRSSTGVTIGHSVAANVNVQAGWETLGTFIFVALIVALFAFGIISNVRKRRRTASAGDPDADVEPVVDRGLV